MWLVSDGGNRIDWIVSKKDKFLYNVTDETLLSYTLNTYLELNGDTNIRYKSEQFKNGKILDGNSTTYYPNGIEANLTFYRNGEIKHVTERYPNDNLKIVLSYLDSGIDVKTYNIQDGKLDLHTFIDT